MDLQNTIELPNSRQSTAGHGSSSHDESWLVLSGARRGRINKASPTFDFTAETNQTSTTFRLLHLMRILLTTTFLFLTVQVHFKYLTK